ncbi:hypothetical protein MSIBF_A1730016 [groundwater metagenome]|uniref:Uncharacterized protein n=1 Tax=groundwater metagenome TaxID=717931 RepID=A0A098E779_9ZZZZ
MRFLLNGILYVAYEQEIYSLLTLRFHKFEKTQSVKLGSIYSKWYHLIQQAVRECKS